MHRDLIVWLNSLWIQGLTLQYMHCKYALSCYHHSYELHISLSCRKRKAYHYYCLGKDPQIPHILRDLRVTYNGNLQKLRNNGWTKNMRHSAWLDRSVFQLLKTQVKATSLIVKGNMSKFENQISFFLIRRRILVWTHVYFWEVSKVFSKILNSWPIDKFSFA